MASQLRARVKAQGGGAGGGDCMRTIGVVCHSDIIHLILNALFFPGEENARMQFANYNCALTAVDLHCGPRGGQHAGKQQAVKQSAKFDGVEVTFQMFNSIVHLLDPLLVKIECCGV